jgi:hypoxanthine-guanine phosphoribosyltransferase
LFEIEKNEKINEFISITKSNSGISGPILAKAHMELGESLATAFCDLEPADTTIVALLRGGLFFAEGIYFKLGCKFQTYNPKTESFVRPKTKNIILVDSVINTGKTIQEILEPDMYIACCVINHKAVPIFDKQLYTIRVSENSFVGADVSQQTGNKGPDTTMRLFNLI